MLKLFFDKNSVYNMENLNAAFNISRSSEQHCHPTHLTRAIITPVAIGAHIELFRLNNLHNNLSKNEPHSRDKVHVRRRKSTDY